MKHTHAPLPLNRRTFLRASALSALATAGCVSPHRTSANYIDAHVHVWTPDTQRYPLAEGYSRETDMVPPSFTPTELFAHCRSLEVSRIVLIQMSFYKFDNSYMLDVMASQPAAFSGVAIVDESKPNLGAAMESLSQKGVRGFRVRASRELAEAWRGSQAMRKMWSHAADKGLSICLLADPDALPAVHAMCKEYPKTRVVIDHFARIGANGSMEPQDMEQLSRISDFEHTFVKTSAFYALGAKTPPYDDLAPMIRTLHAAYGARRLMWASDCPYQVQPGHSYADSIALIRDRLDFLNGEDKEWMLRKTAEHVFFS
jgi:predicted TIM-barrel fold metal-dependent hydrolase